jgi:hypothetical protein
MRILFSVWLPVLVLRAAVVRAQENAGVATIGGTVLDSSGKALPDASVLARNAYEQHREIFSAYDSEDLCDH